MTSKEIKEEYDKIIEIVKYWYFDYEEIGRLDTWQEFMRSLDNIRKYIEKNEELEKKGEK